MFSFLLVDIQQTGFFKVEEPIEAIAPASIKQQPSFQTLSSRKISVKGSQYKPGYQP
jgi:hypothetical protein